MSRGDRYGSFVRQSSIIEEICIGAASCKASLILYVHGEFVGWVAPS